VVAAVSLENEPSTARSAFGSQRDLIVRVHIENRNGGPANSGSAEDEDDLERQMILPNLLPWVKQLGHCSGDRVDAG
jgi:hypothetical protein